MPALKGHEKSGGRQVGSKNIIQYSIKQKVTDILQKYILAGDGELRSMEEDLMALRPVDRIQMAERLMKYVIPVLGTEKVDKDDNKEGVVINVKFVKGQTSAELDGDEACEDIDYSDSID